MAGSSYGTLFRIHTFGESHGPAIGVLIDGCPPQIPFDHDFLALQMARRRPGQSKLSTERSEADQVEVMSGVFEGRTTGTPIMLMIRNKDQRSKDYSNIAANYRPSHADYTYDQKYGFRDYKGGGRSSARETAARVAAGAVAQMVLKTLGVKVQAGVTQVGPVAISGDLSALDYNTCEDNLVRCPDAKAAQDMEAAILEAKQAGDSLGGRVTGVVYNCPTGLGEPVFDKFHAELGKAMLSINAVKGFEYGSGFAAASMRGSAHNDLFAREGDTTITTSNHSGGVQGGITNGMPIYFNVAFKPVATIKQAQSTVNQDGEAAVLKARGRHDPCVVPRAVPIVEAMAALVTLDFYLRQQAIQLGIE